MAKSDLESDTGGDDVSKEKNITQQEKKDDLDKVADVKEAASDSEEEQNEKGGLSNKKKKLKYRMNVADMKLNCSRPAVVEVWDATAADPKLLVFLKICRNTVSVPRYWSQKRKYLQVCIDGCQE